VERHVVECTDATRLLAELRENQDKSSVLFTKKSPLMMIGTQQREAENPLATVEDDAGQIP
jgi:hypothetical protein